jgi:phosphoribosyl-ATP pyrophosphohydrolase
MTDKEIEEATNDLFHHIIYTLTENGVQMNDAVIVASKMESRFKELLRKSS